MPRGAEATVSPWGEGVRFVGASVFAEVRATPEEQVGRHRCELKGAGAKRDGVGVAVEAAKRADTPFMRMRRCSLGGTATSSASSRRVTLLLS